MNNQEILRKIVNYIENVMKEKSLTSVIWLIFASRKPGKCLQELSTTCLKPLPLQLYPLC